MTNDDFRARIAPVAPPIPLEGGYLTPRSQDACRVPYRAGMGRALRTDPSLLRTAPGGCSRSRNVDADWPPAPELNSQCQ